MLRALETGQVGSDLGNHLERGGRVDAVDACQIDTAESKQGRTYVEMRRIFRTRRALALARITLIIPHQCRKHAFKLGIALKHLRAVGVKQCHRLLEGK